MIDFPASPTVGSTFVNGGQQWTWDGTKWLPAGGAAAYWPPPMNDNRLINGDMWIDQRNNGASGTAAGYTADRWYWATNLNKGTWQRAASGPPGFPYSLLFTSSSAYTAAAGDTFFFQQPIEADAVSDFAWGTANAQPVTLSFWASSNKSGTYSGSIQNYASNRSFPFSFPLTSAWSKVVINIPGDTGGTWVMAGNSGGVCLNFDVGSGANSRGPVNVWSSGNYVGVTGAASIVATNSASFNITGVKLEIGSIATPFNHQSLAKSLADCQRYYQYRPVVVDGSYSSAGGTPNYRTMVIPPMRAMPTMTFSNIGYNNTTNLNNYNADTLEVTYAYSSVAAGNISVQFAMTLSAEL